MTGTTTTSLGVHLYTGKLTGVVNHQEHQHSDGLYPVLTLELGGFELTIYPSRERAIELADVLTLMAADLRAGAERYVNALQD